MPTVAIIGGGFSGTLTAVHLLRRGAGADVRVIIINRSGAMARGVAYGTQSTRLVLNVPAGGMSAFEHEPDSFVRFVRQQGVEADGATFVSRHLYGAYLEMLLNVAAEEAEGARLERVTAEVLEIQPSPDGKHAWLSLSDGSRIRADRVVLAVGNYPPGTPAIADGTFLTTSHRYVPDPWAPGALAAVDPGAATLLIGTGLTMVDMVLELKSLGINTPCVAISRHGLVPTSHRMPSNVSAETDGAPAIDPASATVRAYVRTFRKHVRDAAARGADWRDAIASLRPMTSGLWHALALDERRRFLRHVRPFWEVHRHRLAPQIHDAFVTLRESGHVSIVAGRILDLRETADRVHVRIRKRGSAESLDLQVGTVINCTGPTGDTRELRDALFIGLRERGLLRPDPLGLGIETSATGAVIDADGVASQTLYYVGPFLKARDWEATAVPELRRYARQLADHLLERLRNLKQVVQRPAHM